ncbi:MAG: LysE family translocator [Dongiaceae bacterium]
MLSFLPDPGTLAPFLVAALALNLTPGADMAYVIARAAGQGRAAGISSSFGIAAGSFLHSLLAAIGLSAILLHSEAAFQAIKYAGAAYLLYLAWKAVRDTGDARAGATRAPAGLWRIFFAGLLTNLLNPKVALFIMAFLPQFVAPARGNVAGQILFLGLLFNVGGTTVNLIVTQSIATAGRFVKASPRFGRLMQRLSALVFVGLALRLALSERT